MKTTISIAALLIAATFAPGCTVDNGDKLCNTVSATTTSCEGAVLVASCSSGSVTRTTCDATACPANKRALGCRIGQDDRAFCECGCTEAEDACSSDNTLRSCFGGELVETVCSDALCRQAGFGRNLGCGVAEDGKRSCLCEAT